MRLLSKASMIFVVGGVFLCGISYAFAYPISLRPATAIYVGEGLVISGLCVLIWVLDSFCRLRMPWSERISLIGLSVFIPVTAECIQSWIVTQRPYYEVRQVLLSEPLHYIVIGFLAG